MDVETKDEAHWRAREFVGEIVTMQLMADLCLLARDPLAEADRKAARMFDALDFATDAGVESEWFNQCALHEMEQFWARVRREVEYQLDRREQEG
mgnify:CR=1 FL=1